MFPAAFGSFKYPVWQFFQICTRKDKFWIHAIEMQSSQNWFICNDDWTSGSCICNKRT